MATSKTELLIIDPQVDFCDPKRGALYVGGAERDIDALEAFVSRLGSILDAVHVTLDSHNTLHIAHPVYWERPERDTGAGNSSKYRGEARRHPRPFTIITAEEIARGDWRATDPAQREYGADYVKALEADGRYQLCIWPYHCLIGTPGHDVMPQLADALAKWETKYLRAVNYIFKGSNPRTEHYSAVRAEMPVPSDPNTQTNQGLMEMMRRVDTLLVAGEAGSHCVANTVRDLVDAGGEDSARKIILFTDATSPVRGFEAAQDSFIADLKQRGMRTTTSGEYHHEYASPDTPLPVLS